MHRYRFNFATFHHCDARVFLHHAQEVEDTIKIKTRVVFLDALVKDKKPISRSPICD